MNKLALVDIKKLKKGSNYILKESEQLLKNVHKTLESQEAFFKKALGDAAELKKLLENYKIPEDVQHSLDLWQSNLQLEQAQLAIKTKKEIKQEETLLVPKKRNSVRTNKKRCTRIF